VKVLFLCTGNSARSILAEAILNREGQGRVQAFSAGSHPKAEVHPMALRLLSELGYPVAQLRSKSWSEFAGPAAPELEFIFTVCDNAAGETCPIWPGHPMTVHWGLPDPAAVAGSEAKRLGAFEATYRSLQTRIAKFINLSMGGMDKAELKVKLIEIGAS
jgi:arsenate reductase